VEGAAMSSTVLVTGISGYIAKQCALTLMSAGYRVRGTVRGMAKAEQVRATLAPHADIAKLEFVEADLLADAGWHDAVRDCHAVLHLASPFPIANPKNENDLIRPAVEGTLRVMKAARANGVKRFVQTSSVAAIYAGHPASRTEPFTEDDWSDVNGPGITPYEKSKTLAERAARDFMDRDGGDMHYCSVNPGLVLGPALDADVEASADVLLMLLRGTYPALPPVSYPIVDVRDVAVMHLKALETAEPSGGRYMGVDRPMRFVEIARAIKAGLGAEARKVPSRELPGFVVRILALFDSSAATIVPHLGRELRVDNSRTRRALDMTFRPGDRAAVDMARNLIDLELV
jgi:dihydroflavonol-4-reductase